LLDLTVKVFVDSAVFLICKTFFGKIEQASLTSAISDHDSTKFALQESQPLADIVIVVSVIIWVVILSEQAKVPKLTFDALIALHVVQTLRIGGL
jgi:hypothetical protein